MRCHPLLILGFALVTGACGDRPPEAPATPTGTEAATAAAPGTNVDETFLAHMHEHADKLDELNFALDDGRLEAAQSPAYWLSRHDSPAGIPAEWQTYVDGMRIAAEAVERADDLAAARAAAERIVRNCRGCHTAAGVSAP